MVRGPTEAPTLYNEHLRLPLDVFLLIASYFPPDLFVGSLPIQSTCKTWAILFKNSTKRPKINSDTVTTSCKSSHDAMRVMTDPLKVKHLSLEQFLTIAALSNELFSAMVKEPSILQGLLKHPELSFLREARELAHIFGGLPESSNTLPCSPNYYEEIIKPLHLLAVALNNPLPIPAEKPKESSFCRIG